MSIRPERKRKERTLEEKAAWAAYMREYWRQRPEAYAAMLAKQKAKKTSTKTYRRNKDKPEFREAKQKRDRKHWQNRSDAAKQKHRDRTGAAHYGMAPAEYARRKGLDCELCGKHAPRGKRGGGMHIDHDHETGQIRGTLCRNCNVALGAFGDSIEKLEAAAAYLRLWKEKAKSV